METYTVKKSSYCLIQKCFNLNIPMNVAIEIRLKIDPTWHQQKCISGDFPQLLELSVLRTHISTTELLDCS